MGSESEIEDWADWLDKDEKREELNTNIAEKDEELRKNIVQNNLDDIADFMDFGDAKNSAQKNKKVDGYEEGTKKGGEKTLKLEDTPFNSIKDCQTLGETLAMRIERSKAKSVAIERFLTIILSACETKLDDKDLQTTLRKIQGFIQKRENNKRFKAMNKKKPNDLRNSMKNYQEEIDMIYGDLSEEDDENYEYSD